MVIHGFETLSVIDDNQASIEKVANELMCPAAAATVLLELDIRTQ